MVTDMKITGRPAQFGRGVISDVGDKIIGQFAECLSTRLAEPAERAEPAARGRTDRRLQLRAGSDARGRDGAPPRRRSRPAVPPPPRDPGAGSTAREPAEVNLGSVVGPVLLKRYGPWVGGLVVVAIIVWLTRG